jgi:hypothetical protein
MQELSAGASQRGLAEEDQLRQALAFDGPYPAFSKGIQIRTAGRQQNWLYTAGSDGGPKGRTEFCVAIVQRKANRPKKPSISSVALRAWLRQPLVGVLYVRAACRSRRFCFQRPGTRSAAGFPDSPFR